jgi:hypothetical protein
MSPPNAAGTKDESRSVPIAPKRTEEDGRRKPSNRVLCEKAHPSPHLRVYTWESVTEWEHGILMPGTLKKDRDMVAGAREFYLYLVPKL